MSNSATDLGANKNAEPENTQEKTENQTPAATPTEKITSPEKPAEKAENNAAPASVSSGETKAENKDSGFDPSKMGVLNDLNIALTIEIGQAEIKIRDLLNLTKGSIIELNKLSGEPVEMYANGKLIALGEIITVNGKYSVRLLSFNENMQIGAKGNGK